MTSMNKIAVVATLATAMLIAAAPTALAKKWIVNTAQSSIGFSGTHAGSAFNGQFKSWMADISFDPENLATARAVVKIDLTSAATGNITYDRTLPQPDWLDTGKQSEAVFSTENIKRRNGGGAENAYTADGTLTLRGQAVPVSLDFTLDIEDGVARMSGETALARLDYGIGATSDKAGSWVSLAIPVKIELVANAAD